MHPYLLALAVACFAPAAASENPDPRLEQSRALSAQLATQLKARLMSAMQESGPVAAIEVCNTEALEIAQSLSSEEMSVSRTALKVRNPHNAATPEQRATLQAFSAQLAADPSQVPEQFSIREDGSAAYMRAIPMAAPCLACHGSALPEPVAAKITALYPDDQATGFAPGELRGAFVVSWPAPN